MSPPPRGAVCSLRIETKRALSQAIVLRGGSISRSRSNDILPLLRGMRGTPSGQVMSLVTAANQFYSILMLERMTERGIWICAGKRQVTGVRYDALSRELITTASQKI